MAEKDEDDSAAPLTKHPITLQMQRQLKGAVNSPDEMVKKSKLKGTERTV